MYQAEDYEVVVPYSRYITGFTGYGFIVINGRVLQVAFTDGGVTADIGFEDRGPCVRTTAISRRRVTKFSCIDFTDGKVKKILRGSLRFPVKTIKVTDEDTISLLGTKVKIEVKDIYPEHPDDENAIPSHMKITISKVS